MKICLHLNRQEALTNVGAVFNDGSRLTDVESDEVSREPHPGHGAIRRESPMHVFSSGVDAPHRHHLFVDDHVSLDRPTRPTSALAVPYNDAPHPYSHVPPPPPSPSVAARASRPVSAAKKTTGSDGAVGNVALQFPANHGDVNDVDHPHNPLVRRLNGLRRQLPPQRHAVDAFLSHSHTLKWSRDLWDGYFQRHDGTLRFLFQTPGLLLDAQVPVAAGIAPAAPNMIVLEAQRMTTAVLQHPFDEFVHAVHVHTFGLPHGDQKLAEAIVSVAFHRRYSQEVDLMASLLEDRLLSPAVLIICAVRYLSFHCLDGLRMPGALNFFSDIEYVDLHRARNILHMLWANLPQSLAKLQDQLGHCARAWSSAHLTSSQHVFVNSAVALGRRRSQHPSPPTTTPLPADSHPPNAEPTARERRGAFAVRRDMARAKLRAPLPTELGTHQVYSTLSESCSLLSGPTPLVASRTAPAVVVADQCVSLMVLTRLVITEFQTVVLQRNLTSWMDGVWARIKEPEHDYVAWEGFKCLYASIVPTPQLECDTLYMDLLEKGEGEHMGASRVAVANLIQSLIHDGHSVTLQPLPDTVKRALRSLGVPQ